MRIEKADRFWSAPSGTKPQVSCAWRVTLRGNAQRFSPTVTDATERTITMRMKFCTQSSTHHFLTIFHGNMSGALKLLNRNRHKLSMMSILVVLAGFASHRRHNSTGGKNEFPRLKAKEFASSNCPAWNSADNEFVFDLDVHGPHVMGIAP